jgi:hypothetical protein
MTAEYSQERDHYSFCIVQVNGNSYMYYRVADFYPEEDKNTIKRIETIWQRNASFSNPENPEYLYNPSARRQHESRESDVFLLRWQPNRERPDRPQNFSYIDDPELTKYGEPKEVFIVHGNEDGLRRSLSAGIPFAGRTTDVFYIVYNRDGDRCEAIRCDKKDFVFSEGLIRLKVDPANVRNTLLSAPKVLLKGYDIIESSEKTGYRMLYSKLGELDSEGNVPLRPLSYFASDYVKWFESECGLNISKSEKRDLGKIVQSALTHPEEIESYLGVKAPAEEVDSLKKAIAGFVNEQDDEARNIIKEALLDDEQFRDECAKQALRSNENELTDGDKAENDPIEELNEELEKGRQTLKSERKEKEKIRKELSETKAALNAIRKEKKSASLEKQGDIPQANESFDFAGSFQEGVPHRTLVEYFPGSEVPCSDTSEVFAKAVSTNLKKLGAVSINESSADARALAAVSISSALVASNVLVAPQPIARAVADAVSIALCGETSSRVWIPGDFRDAAAVAAQLNNSDSPVVLVDNVIDSVNEGLINRLVYEDVKPIVILSFMSHESARLLAKEAWECMFLPSVESLSICKTAFRDSGYRRADGAPQDAVKIDTDGIADAAKEIKEELHSITISDGCALLTGAVLGTAKTIASGKLIGENDGKALVGQHIAMSSINSSDALDNLSDWVGGDSGLERLAERIGLTEA